jgi:hypothetical protein
MAQRAFRDPPPGEHRNRISQYVYAVRWQSDYRGEARFQLIYFASWDVMNHNANRFRPRLDTV